MKRLALLVWLLALCPFLSGCGGGQEIESCLFVIAMAVDPAPDGNLTVTVKALSGTQEGGAQNTQGGASGGESGAQEQSEPGYIVLSASAPSCLRALNLLSGTTPRTVNLSHLGEVVLNETLARTDAALSILQEIHAMYRADGSAVVVVTPDDAGDFIRRQRAILGVRLSRYLQVLFDHFDQLDTIPPHAHLAEVIAAMRSGTHDAAAVYAAGNEFDSALLLGGAELDRLPGHLPRTSPANNEYLGSALFSGPRMTGTLTGEETGLLRLMTGTAKRRTAFIGDAQYKTNLRTRVTRSIAPDGALCVSVRMNLTHLAGGERAMEKEIAARIERDMASVLFKLKAAGCDAAGFGYLAVRRYLSRPEWEESGWQQRYEAAPVRVRADVRIR